MIQARGRLPSVAATRWVPASLPTQTCPGWSEIGSGPGTRPWRRPEPKPTAANGHLARVVP